MARQGSGCGHGQEVGVVSVHVTVYAETRHLSIRRYGRSKLLSSYTT